MGSKKHKKESKKRKHRSRSRSPLGNEERERKKHRKHKDRKKDRSPDVEEVPVDSHLQKSIPEPNSDSRSSRSTSTERDRRVRSEHRHAHAHSSTSHADVEPDASPVAADSGGAQASLSIDETNRLRAKLGLKPLQVSEKAADDGKIKDDLGEFYHRPAANIAQQKKSDKIKERLAERKEKRQLEHKLQSTRTLGEASDEDDASAWVERSRQVQQQKDEAARRAALLDEMDAAFGVSALVEEAEDTRRSRTYGERHLRGLRVAHRLDALQEERETVLTLADKDVLADDDEDVLVNVNMLDEERYRKNIEERKKAAKGYEAYDEEAELEAAMGGQRAVLKKYDESLDDKDRGFRIGDEDAAQAAIFRDLLRRQRAAGGDGRRLESLQTAPLQLATDYLDRDDVKFKKVKKRGKLRRRPKTEAIDVDEYETSGAPLHTDDTEAPPALPQDDDEVEVDGELQAALARARRLRQEAAPLPPPPLPPALASEGVEEEPAAEEGMVLDATAEFCRTLGDIPTYGLAGNRDRKTEVMELEEESEPEEAGAARGWSSVDVEREGEAAEAAGGGALAAEPALGRGVAGALSLARSKGYLERGAGAARPAPSKHALQARHYSIEDKAQAEDDKYSRRERGALCGPLHDFREKAGFRPSIKLEYVDDEGRPLCPKEAFRYLSHKFHGKGPGKNKQEKRLKKAVQEGLMKKMSSTDTPLNTLQMLQEKQRETHSPYIVLSGAKRPDND